MSYQTPISTGEELGKSDPESFRTVILKTTASQGAKSDHYIAYRSTGKSVSGKFQRKDADRFKGQTPKTKKEVGIAEHSHINGLLKSCKEKSEQIVNTTDPIDSALLGNALSSYLQDLWTFRKNREEEFSEILNTLQIVLAKENFETLEIEKRSALAQIFEECLVRRIVGRPDCDRALKILTKAGFDIWGGLHETTEDSQ